jgi:hypothetical protein
MNFMSFHNSFFKTAITKNAKKRMIRKSAFGVQAVSNVEEVLDKRFVDEKKENQVRVLQLKVKGLMEKLNVPFQVVPDTERVSKFIKSNIFILKLHI